MVAGPDWTVTGTPVPLQVRRIVASASVTDSLKVTDRGALRATFEAPLAGELPDTRGAASPGRSKVCPLFGEPKLDGASAFHVKL